MKTNKKIGKNPKFITEKEALKKIKKLGKPILGTRFVMSKQNKPTISQEWEKEFDTVFFGQTYLRRGDVVEFVRSLLASQRKELVEEVWSAVRNTLRSEMRQRLEEKLK